MIDGKRDVPSCHSQASRSQPLAAPHVSASLLRIALAAQVRDKGGDEDPLETLLRDVRARWHDSSLAAALHLWFAYIVRSERRRVGYERRAAANIDPDKPRVFLSYQTSQHLSIVQQVHRSLEEQGFDVWFDYDRGTLPTRVLYLDALLERALQAADVLVLLPGAVTTNQAASEAEEKDWAFSILLRLNVMLYLPLLAPAAMASAMKDLEDDEASIEFLTLLRVYSVIFRMSVPPPIRAMWTKALYGIDIEKAINERWQEWERRLAGFHGLAIVTVGLVTEAEAEATPSPTDVLLSPRKLDQDVRTLLVPLLLRRRRREDAPTLLPRWQRLWDRRRQIILAGLAALSFIILSAFLAGGFVSWRLIKLVRHRAARSP